MKLDIDSEVWNFICNIQFYHFLKRVETIYIAISVPIMVAVIVVISSVVKVAVEIVIN